MLEPMESNSTLDRLPKCSGEFIGSDRGVVPKADELAVASHQIDDAGMVHRVVSTLKRLLFQIDAIKAGDFLDRSKVAGKPDKARAERGEIGLELGGRVALGID